MDFKFFLTCLWQPPDLEPHGSGSHETPMDDWDMVHHVPDVQNTFLRPKNSVPGQNSTCSQAATCHGRHRRDELTCSAGEFVARSLLVQMGTVTMAMWPRGHMATWLRGHVAAWLRGWLDRSAPPR